MQDSLNPRNTKAVIGKLFVGSLSRGSLRVEKPDMGGDLYSEIDIPSYRLRNVSTSAVKPRRMRCSGGPSVFSCRSPRSGTRRSASRACTPGLCPRIRSRPPASPSACPRMPASRSPAFATICGYAGNNLDTAFVSERSPARFDVQDESAARSVAGVFARSQTPSNPASTLTVLMPISSTA